MKRLEYINGTLCTTDSSGVSNTMPQQLQTQSEEQSSSDAPLVCSVAWLSWAEKITLLTSAQGNTDAVKKYIDMMSVNNFMVQYNKLKENLTYLMIVFCSGCITSQHIVQHNLML